MDHLDHGQLAVMAQTLRELFALQAAPDDHFGFDRYMCAHEALVNGAGNSILVSTARVVISLLKSHISGSPTRYVFDSVCSLRAFCVLIGPLGEGNAPAAKAHWERQREAFAIQCQVMLAAGLKN